MLFRHVFFLSVLVASVSATPAIHPLLVSRQTGQCQSPCAPIVKAKPRIDSGACGYSCICTNSFISAVSSCVNCLQQTGQSLDGFPPNEAQILVNACDQAGYPVSSISGGSTITTTAAATASTSSGGSSGSGSSGGSSGGGSSGGSSGGGSSGGSSGGGSSGGSSGAGGFGGLKSGGAIGLSANLGGVFAVAIAAGCVLVVLSV